MRLRTIAPFSTACLVLLTASSPARGQMFSVYANVGGTHSSNVQIGSDGKTAGGWSPNIGGGVTVNFLNLHVVKLGVDARGSGGTGDAATATAEISLRAGFQPPVIRLKPWVQVGAGYAAATVPIVSGVGSTYTGKFVTVGGHAGVDRPIAPFFDWRMVDVGYAHGFDTRSGFASGKSNTGANLFSISTGLVARF